MPPVSQAQRGAMYAAASGKSTIGIPQSVGQEFTQHDSGGKLPHYTSQVNQGMKRKAMAGVRPPSAVKSPGFGGHK